MFDRDHIDAPYAAAVPVRSGAPIYNARGHFKACANRCGETAPKHDPYCATCRAAIERRTLDDTSCGYL